MLHIFFLYLFHNVVSLQLSTAIFPGGLKTVLFCRTTNVVIGQTPQKDIVLSFVCVWVRLCVCVWGGVFAGHMLDKQKQNRFSVAGHS